jgi:hypothetical protein
MDLSALNVGQQTTPSAMASAGATLAPATAAPADNWI